MYALIFSIYYIFISFSIIIVSIVYIYFYTLIVRQLGCKLCLFTLVPSCFLFGSVYYKAFKLIPNGLTVPFEDM